MKLFLFYVIVIGSIWSCSNHKATEVNKAETTTTNIVDIEASDSITKTFVIPDSINTALIIATYVEIEPESHTLIIYNDISKKTATVLRYLNDGTVSKDKLEVVSENIFRQSATKEAYEITDSSVVYTALNGSKTQSKFHYRTDGPY